MDNAQVFAHRYFNKIEDSLVPVAIFVRDGIPATTKINTAQYLHACKNRLHTLVGVYDEKCRAEWVEDDLRYAGVK